MDVRGGRGRHRCAPVSVSSAPTLAIDSRGDLHVAYDREPAIPGGAAMTYYAVCDGRGWVHSLLGGGREPWLTLDPAGVPQIACWGPMGILIAMGTTCRYVSGS